MGSFKVTRSETDIVRLAVSEIRSKSPDVKTILLDNSAGRFAAYKAGQHAKLCVTVGGCERWKSFTISSSPTQAGLVALTIKRNPRGTVSRWLHEQAAVDGAQVEGCVIMAIGQLLHEAACLDVGGFAARRFADYPMARLAVPPRLALNRPGGAFSDAPLAKVTFTTDL